MEIATWNTLGKAQLSKGVRCSGPQFGIGEHVYIHSFENNSSENTVYYGVRFITFSYDLAKSGSNHAG